MLSNLRIQWRSGAGVVLQAFMSQKAVRFCHKEILLRKYSFIVEQSHKPPSHRSKRVKCPSQRPLREAKPTGPKGIILFGFPPKEVESVRTWLSGVNLRVVSGDGILRRSSPVSEALHLLTSSVIPVEEEGEMLTFFTRVVLFSGLSGEEMQGLVEVWEDALSDGQISYGYITTHMMEDSIERVLIKIISASDENDMKNVSTR
ncbi:hypothetical protein PSENEW3n2_00000757 [Picochlorum sp. SENEW3]|nr:hypothetical protein PSENEW3n2_00000757 [Picochlorum sp. SENEW3]WPT15678.1 hypothetical protein PSENEW3_00000757 [Picochlorum sp. SENEW3]